MSESIAWEETAQAQFNQMIEKVPVFMRSIAKETVSKKAQCIAIKEGHSEVMQKDMIDAFFAATPFGFHGPMKTDMKSLGIDYMKYGYEQ